MSLVTFSPEESTLINPGQLEPLTGIFGAITVGGCTGFLHAYSRSFLLASPNACLLGTEVVELPPSVNDPPFPPVWPYLFSTSVIYGRDHLSTNLKMVRGDDITFNIAVTLDGSPVNLTGATLRMTAKWRYVDADGSALFTRTSPASGITITDAVGGLAAINIVPANTSTLPAHEVRLVYDIQLTDSLGKPTTVMSGTFIVIPDVSISTP